MLKVYAVVGWFGDNEWVESVWATEDAAAAEVARIKDDRAVVTSDYSYLHKFAIEEWEVRDVSR